MILCPAEGSGAQGLAEGLGPPQKGRLNSRMLAAGQFPGEHNAAPIPTGKCPGLT